MDERTTGLILRTRPLTETSLIVQWLTPDLGRVSTVAKGARRPKSPFLGKLDLFYLAEFSFHPSRRSDLHTLREVRVLEYHRELRIEMGYLQQASYFAQLLEQTTEANTPLPGLFELVAEVIRGLPGAPPDPATVYAFELRLLTELGFDPEYSESTLTTGAREIVKRLGGADWPTVRRITLSHGQNHEIQRFLGEFLIFHFGRVPKARVLACAARPG